jgi:hypothetical protein
MNRKAFSILAGVALATALSVSAYAQSGDLRAHIPFSFAVEKSVMPAGDYALVQLSQNTWTIRNENSTKAIAAAARPDGDNPEPNVAKLVFTKYGEHYFLSRVWCDGLTSVIAEPKPERALEIQMTSSNLKPETVYVLASR